MATSYSRGHEIYYDWKMEKWKYSDIDEVVNDNRPCKRCGCKPTQEGYDACLGYIDGATSACCGHGIEEEYMIVEYNNYRAEIKYSREDKVYFGKVLDIDDTIIFEVKNLNKTYGVFKAAIEDYLEMCNEIGKNIN